MTKTFLLASSAALSLLLCTHIDAQSVASAQPARRVVEAVDSGDRIALKGATRPWVKKAADLGELPGGTAAARMVLLLKRSTQQQQALTEYLSDVQNPASASYHQWLTPAQFADRFGVNADDVQAVTGWLESQGFKIDKVAKARNLIEFSGTASQLQQAFQAQIHRLALQGKTQATSLNGVQIPRALAPVITGLVNLDSAHPHPLVQPAGKGKYDAATHRIQPELTIFDGTTPSLYVDPADAAVIYNTPNATLNTNYKGSTLDGTGVTVGVVGVSDVDLTGVSNYRQAFLGETASNVNLPTLVVDGNDPGENDAVVESWLDLEVLGGIAPKAKLIYYSSNETDINDGLDTAIARAVEDNNISILSISYGECEANLGTSGNAFYSEIFEQAAAQGITVSVSSGDSGSAGCDADTSETAVNGLTVSGLASTPYNIAVGGTDFDLLTNNFATYVEDQDNGNPPYYLTAKSYIPEEPWNDSTVVNTTLDNNVPLEPGGVTDIIAGSGGVSSVYSKPAFQSALTPADGQRDMPDVAFLAGNGLYSASWVLCESTNQEVDCQTTNGQLTDGSTVNGAGGTSAAAPAFAGMLALVEQSTGSRLGQANTILYQLAKSKYSTVFHDVTTGNNSVVCSSGTPDCGGNGFLTGYNAGTGYDLASGLGSVDAAALVQNWKTVGTAASSTKLTINGATSAVNVAHGTSLEFQVAVDPATASGVAGLIANTSSLGGQLAIPIANGSGSANYNGLPGGSYTVYARYDGDGTNAASSSAPISVEIAAEPSTTGVQINAYDLTGNPITTLNAIPYGSLIFAEASVYGTAEGQANSQGIATGSISYSDNGTSLGSLPISSLGFTSYPNYAPGAYSFFNGGTHKIVASYPGDASYKASTSSPAAFTVTKAALQISVAPNPPSTTSVRNDTVTITLLSAGAGNGPTGTVTLTSNGVTLGTTTRIESLSTPAGNTYGLVVFTLKASQLQPGANPLLATYSGDNNYQGGSATANVTLSEATFSLSTAPINVTAGSTTGNTAVIKATPLNDFTGVVNLSCSVTTTPANATSPVTCTVPATINLTGLNPVTGTLTANTTASTTAGSYTITITGKDAATGKITASTTSTVTVTGTTAAPSIALSNSGNITIAPGAASGDTSTISVTPAGGFTGAVSLSCAVAAPTGATDPVTCALSNATVTLSGASAATSTLTISSTAASAAVLRRGFGIGGAVIAVLLLLLPARRRLAPLACVLVLAAAAGVLSGCGGSGTPAPPSNPGTSAGAYVVTITGTASGVTAASTTVNVTVN